jgi:recombinational DNA repair ATPase RecF
MIRHDAGGRDADRLVLLLSETLSNLDAEHRERLAGATRTARTPSLRAQVVSTLTQRHRERRSAYVDAIRRLRAAGPAKDTP